MLKLDSIFVPNYLPNATDKPLEKTPARLSQTIAFNCILSDVNRRRIKMINVREPKNWLHRPYPHLPRLACPPTDTSHGESCSVDKHTDLSGQTSESKWHLFAGKYPGLFIWAEMQLHGHKYAYYCYRYRLSQSRFRGPVIVRFGLSQIKTN